MNAETQDILYRRNVARYQGWGGVFSDSYEQCPKCGGSGWTEWAAGVTGNCTECHGFGLVGVEHSPAADVIDVTDDTLPDEVAAILALTPHVAENAPWAEREAEAQAASTAGADGLAASWAFFVEKKINYEPDGDVLWA